MMPAVTNTEAANQEMKLSSRVSLVRCLTGLLRGVKLQDHRHQRPHGEMASVGSVFAAPAWLAVSSLFSWYLGNFANYNATYGAPGGGNKGFVHQHSAAASVSSSELASTLDERGLWEAVGHPAD
jgi:hypothetical protein